MRPNLATLVADFRRHGDQTAIVTHRGNRSLPCSWEDLAKQSARFAHELGRRGIVEGDRVLLWGENSAEWVAAFFGCVLRGVVAVPLDAAGSPEFARRVVREVTPKLIVGSPERIGNLNPASPIPLFPFESMRDALPPPDYRPLPQLSRDSVLQIVFTSGTTAEPKGIVHTHGNVLASLDPLEEEIGKYLRYERLVHPLRFLHTLPLSHVFGQFMGLWVPPLIAAEVHYESRLEAPRLMRTIHRERISVLAAVPRVLDLLRSHLMAEMPGLEEKFAAAAGEKIWKRWWLLRGLHRRFGLKFWAFVCGGATLPLELESFWRTAGFAVIQGYGMTETTALVTLTHPFRPTRGSIGKPLAGREIKIGPDGELLVRGASIANRIWQQGKMQEREEEWLRTGDLAAQDAQGELVFAGRKSDVIVTAAGINIHPQDLEQALRRQPHVRDAVVVAYASPSGPVPLAVMLLDRFEHTQTSEAAAQTNGGRGLTSPEAEAAVSAANRELADFQQIQYLLVWRQPDFPRTSTGKVLRRTIESWADKALETGAPRAPGSGDSAAGPALGDPVIDLLRQIQPAARDRAISDNDRLAEDLHLDSLASVELQSALETRFGVELNDSVWQQTQTVGQLRALLHPREASSGAETSLTSIPAQQNGGVRSSESVDRRLPSGAARETGQDSPRQQVTRAPSGPRQLHEQVFPGWPWWPPIRLLRIAFLEAISCPLVRFLLAPRIERLSSTPEPCLLVANHVTAIDVPLILYGLQAKDRHRIAVAMSGELLGGWRRGEAQRHSYIKLFTPLAYWLVTALFNVFPLPRRSGLRRSFAHAGRALDRGYHVLVFPEGGRASDGRVQKFEPGIGLLAQESQVPVQPIYIAGLAALKRRRMSWSPRFWFRPGPVTVRVGEPLVMARGEDPAAFALRLRDRVLELGKDDPYL